jgi:hypothetical protein
MHCLAHVVREEFDIQFRRIRTELSKPNLQMISSSRFQIQYPLLLFSTARTLHGASMAIDNE